MQGAVLVIALAFVLINLAVDVLNAYLDPATRAAEGDLASDRLSDRAAATAQSGAHCDGFLAGICQAQNIPGRVSSSCCW